MFEKAKEIRLLKKCLKGDLQAFELVVLKYQELVCAISYSGTSDVHHSEDIAHQTFINAWKNLSQLDDLGKFRPWLCSIARNNIRNFIKKKQNDIVGRAGTLESAAGVAADECGPMESAANKERDKLVSDAIEQVPEKYREPLVLYYRQGESVREVGRLLGLSENVVKQRLHRGRQMIKDQLSSVVEERLSASGPKKAFTTAVVAGAAGIAIKGSGVVAASVAAGVAASAGGAGAVSTGGAAVFSGVVAKVAAAIIVVALGVGGVTAYMQAGGEPEVGADVVAEVREDGARAGGDVVEVEVKDVAAEADKIDAAGKETGDVEATEAAEALLDEAESAKAQYVDPNSLTDIHFKQTYSMDNETGINCEIWIKKPDHWRVDERSGKVTVDNGRRRFSIDHEKKTSHLTEFTSPLSEQNVSMVYGLIKMGQNVISGKDPMAGNDNLPSGQVEIKCELLTDKSTAETKAFVLTAENTPSTELYVNANTGLVEKMRQANEQYWMEFEFEFEYSEISLDVFSMKSPDGYEELGEGLPPKFQGWIFDEDLNPVPNADIYLLGRNGWSKAKGKSDSKGEFNFNIPVGDHGADRALNYPVLVRAVSKDHPESVAWTVIMHPESEEVLPARIPSSGEIRGEVKGDDPFGECLAVSNVSLVMEPAVVISGQILDKTDKTPIDNATVSIAAWMWEKWGDLLGSFPGNSDRGTLEAKTDAEGYYVFESIPTFLLSEELLKIYNAIEPSDKAEFDQKNTVNLSLKTKAEGYLGNQFSLTLKPEDFLTNRHMDVSLHRADVTVRGRVVNNYGEPLVGYIFYHYRKTSTGSMSGLGSQERTNENGEFEMAGCAYDESLAIKIGTDRKPHDWDKSELTKDREFVYYGDKMIPVPLEEGKYEYYVDVVLEKPEMEVVFDIRDSDGEPIEAVPVQINWSGSSIGPELSRALKGVTDDSGQFVITGLPRISDESFHFTINQGFQDKAGDGNEMVLREELSQYTSFSHQIQEMPSGEVGHLVEVVLGRKDEKISEKERVKVHGVSGELVGQ